MLKYRRNTAYKVLHHLLYAESVLESGVLLSSLTPEEANIRRVSVSVRKSARHLRLTTKRFDEGIAYLVDYKLAQVFIKEPGRYTIDLLLPKGHHE